MNAPPVITQEPIVTKPANRWMVFMAISIAIHAAVVLGMPNIIVPPRLSSQLSKVVITGLISLVPFLWSVLVLFVYRTRSERLVGYVSLVVSFVWLYYAYSWVIMAAREL